MGPVSWRWGGDDFQYHVFIHNIQKLPLLKCRSHVKVPELLTRHDPFCSNEIVELHEKCTGLRHFEAEQPQSILLQTSLHRLRLFQQYIDSDHTSAGLS